MLKIRIDSILEEQSNEWKNHPFINDCIKKMEKDPSDLETRY